MSLTARLPYLLPLNQPRPISEPLQDMERVCRARLVFERGSLALSALPMRLLHLELAEWGQAAGVAPVPALAEPAACEAPESGTSEP